MEIYETGLFESQNWKSEDYKIYSRKRVEVVFQEDDQKTVDIMRIPPGRTSVIQPLDKDFF
jgi:hypothetical protein